MVAIETTTTTPLSSTPTLRGGGKRKMTPRSSGNNNNRQTSSSCLFSCSPIAIFGTGLVIIQLIIFRIGLKYFHLTNNTEIIIGGGRQQGSLPGGVSSIITPSSFQQQQQQQRRRRKQQQQQNQRNKRKIYTNDPESLEYKNADGTFNGYPIYLKKTSSKSSDQIRTISHCVGENYQEKLNWMHRSCKFTNLFCFDTTTNDYVVYQSSDDEKLYKHIEERPFIDISQSYMKRSYNHTNTVSLGGINIKWTWNSNGIPRLEWFPEIRSLLDKEEEENNNDNDNDELTYYELPNDVVMIPFHSMNGKNPGHLVWDDFLPIYTLLTMFQLENKSNLLMMRYILKDSDTMRGLWASCDFTDENREACKYMHNKFLPLMMGIDPIHPMTTTEDYDFQITGGDTNKKSNLICAKTGLAGIGGLTDHGVSKMHGWEEDDYKITHNHGRGGNLYGFRNYIVDNLGLPIKFEQKPPFRIVFSEKSSDIPSRYIDFSTQIEVLRRSFNPMYVSVESYVMKELTIQQQVEIASQTSIFITGCGGGAVTATFLPKGSSVFLYYVEDGGLNNGRGSGKPARLDWDLFNNLGYLKVHWLPKTTMRSEVDLRALLILVQHELDGLLREKSYDRFFSAVDKA